MGYTIVNGLNLLLAAAMYTLIGRYLLSLFFAADNRAVIWRVFCQVTDPILRLVRAVTPHVVQDRMIILFAVVWTIMLRVGLLGAYVLSTAQS
jgi:YggT family protein